MIQPQENTRTQVDSVGLQEIQLHKKTAAKDHFEIFRGGLRLPTERFQRTGNRAEVFFC